VFEGSSFVGEGGQRDGKSGRGDGCQKEFAHYAFSNGWLA